MEVIPTVSLSLSEMALSSRRLYDISHTTQLRYMGPICIYCVLRLWALPVGLAPETRGEQATTRTVGVPYRAWLGYRIWFLSGTAVPQPCALLLPPRAREMPHHALQKRPGPSVRGRRGMFTYGIN